MAYVTWSFEIVHLCCHFACKPTTRIRNEVLSLEIITFDWSTIFWWIPVHIHTFYRIWSFIETRQFPWNMIFNRGRCWLWDPPTDVMQMRRSLSQLARANQFQCINHSGLGALCEKLFWQPKPTVQYSQHKHIPFRNSGVQSMFSHTSNNVYFENSQCQSRNKQISSNTTIP